MSSFTLRLEVTPLDDGWRWELIRPFDYYLEYSGMVIRIPVGFVTDFASSPRLFWPIVSPWGRWGKAAVLHDYCYQNHRRLDWWSPFGGSTTWFVCSEMTRRKADRIFLEAMTVLGVKPWRRWLMHRCVRAFGWLAWK